MQERLFKADEALAEDTLQQQSHDRLTRCYPEEFEGVRQRLAAMERPGASLAEQLDFAATLLSRLGEVYERLEPRGRHRLVGSIFPSGVVFSEGH